MEEIWPENNYEWLHSSNEGIKDQDFVNELIRMKNLVYMVLLRENIWKRWPKTTIPKNK